MATNKVYVGDTGTAIIVDSGVDISAATAMSIEVRKPDGVIVSLPANASGLTALRFDTLPDTLDVPGAWRVQPKVTLPSGTWRGETAVMQVYDLWS